MRVESLLNNILHFRGVPNGKSIRKIISQQAQVKRQKISEEFNYKIRTILHNANIQREEIDLFYQTALDKVDADLDLNIAKLQDEVIPEEFKEVSDAVQKLVADKIKIRNEWKTKKREIERKQNEELYLAQNKFQEEMDELADQLQAQLGELYKDAIRQGADIRHQVLASIRKPALPSLPFEENENQ